LGYQILNAKKDYLSIFASHRSSNCDVTNLQIDEDQIFKINDTWGGLNFLHDFGSAKLNIDGKYTYSAFNYSGLIITNLAQIMLSSAWPGPEPQFGINTFPNQVNNLFEIHAGVFSDEASDNNYKINATYTNYGQKQVYVGEPGRKEGRFIIDGDFHAKFNSTMGWGFAGFLKNYDYSSIPSWIKADDTLIERYGNQNYSVLSLNPYFYLEDDNFDLLLGGKVDVEFGGRKKIVAAPTVRFNYYPSDQFLFYLLAEGGRKDNSNYNTYYENRYVDPSFRIWDSRTPLDGTVGIKFLPVRPLSVDIFAGYKITMDEHFYISSLPYSGSNISLVPEYQDANIIKAGANLKYNFQDVFEIDLKGVYYKWDITAKQGNSIPSTLQAWHKPDFVADLNMAYRVPAIPLKLNLLYHGEFGRKTYDLVSDITKMNNINDLSAKATYSFTKFLSVYASANNLLFQKYDIWYGYPAQNFNIMAGINVLF
jgi:hypothetical protein